MRLMCVAVIAALVLFSNPVVSRAQDVSLTSLEGSIELSGTLLGYDGEYYRLDTIYGELTVDGSGVSCQGPGCPTIEDFVADVSVSGSASMAKVLMPALVEGFAQHNGYEAQRVEEDPTHFRYTLVDTRTRKTKAHIRFRSTNADEGFADLLANEADVVMSTRQINSVERARALEAGMGDLTMPARARVLALDAMVPIVSGQNPVREISPIFLARLFAGEIDNWLALGGPDAPVNLHMASTDSGFGQSSEAKLLDFFGLQMSSMVVQHDHSTDLVAAVEADPFAVGIASFAENGSQPLALTGSCGRSLTAFRRSIKTKDYPLSAPLFLYTPARRLPKVAREFLAFTLSQTAQLVIRRAGFVDQTLEEISNDEQGERFLNAITAAGSETPLLEIQRMAAVLAPLKRLTTTFRFDASSAELDAQSKSNVLKLANALAQGRFDARQVYFIGFSDGDGPAVRNKEVALDRAAGVRNAIKDATGAANLDQVTLEIDSFGEALPLACDDTQWGRQANRRVEIWVR
ncbi:MAG: phosphate ABC transporter substrate-binding/OmpA family protein [Roseobacter sp.]